MPSLEKLSSNRVYDIEQPFKTRQTAVACVVSVCVYIYVWKSDSPWQLEESSFVRIIIVNIEG